MFDGGDTNLYGYTWNDPINFIDPEGTFALPLLIVPFVPAIVDALLVGSAVWTGVQINDLINIYMGEHTKNKRPSTEEKHEKGRRRSIMDYGGEKGDNRRDYPKQRPPGWKGPYPPKSTPNQCE